MFTLTNRSLGFFASLIASVTVALTTGCASGGFKLTRTYASFVNKQQIVIRIVIYLLTSIVFVATLLIDLVLFNTMDFWEGRVAAGDYTFSKGDQTFYVKHEVSPADKRKRSTIEVFDSAKKLLQTVVLRETSDGEIEMLVDGTLRTKVRDLASLPKIASYDAQGTLVRDQLAVTEMSTVSVAHAAR